MKVRLADVREEPCRWRETREIPLGVLGVPELVELGPVSWEGEIVWADPGYWLRAELEYDQVLTCGRCLAPAPAHCGLRVELLVIEEDAEVTPGERELEERDLGVVYAEGGEIDLDPVLVEQLQLNVPMRVLCREDCAGLCPRCGADRNREPCSCEPEEPDARWSVLAEWKASRKADD